MQRSITIKNARLLFRNFAGQPDKFNPPGKRTFCIYLDDQPELLEVLRQEGYNIKLLVNSEEGYEIPYLRVNVKYGVRPPKIEQITSAGSIILKEDTVDTLDWAEIVKCDLIITPYEYAPGSISAYLKTMYVTIYEDELDKEYAEILKGIRSDNE